MGMSLSKERKVNGVRIQASKASPGRTAGLWDRLAVLFVLLALMIAGYAIFGFVSASQLALPEAADDSHADSKASPAAQEQTPFDV